MISPELKKKLKDFLPTTHHEIRDLPGGGTYAYISWQKVRAFLDDLCDFHIEFSDPITVENICCVRCTIVIEGVARQGMGVCDTTKKGIRGTFIESAIADSFKNAAEQFGVGAYLDNPDVQDRLKTNGVLVATYKARKAGQTTRN